MRDEPARFGVNESVEQVRAFGVVGGAIDRFSDVVKQGCGEQDGVAGVRDGALKHLQRVVQRVAFGMIDG